MPVGRAFVGEGRTQECRFVEGASCELEADGQAFAVESARDADGRYAGDVEWHGERGEGCAGAELEAFDLDGVFADEGGGARGGRRYEQVYLGEGVAEGLGDAVAGEVGGREVEGFGEWLEEDVAEFFAVGLGVLFEVGCVVEPAFDVDEAPGGDDVFSGEAGIDVLDDGAKAAEHFDGFFDGHEDFGVEQAEELVAGDADAELFDFGDERLAVVDLGKGNSGEIGGVVAGNDVEDDGDVLDGAGEWTCVVEPP